MEPECKNLFSLKGRAAIITGASSGLGAAFARGLAAAGAHVAAAARRTDRLESLVGEIKDAGGKAIAVSCDVQMESDVADLVETTVSQFGRLDILVNNAGIADVAPAETESTDNFRNILDVNVTGAFLCARHCGRAMLEAGSGSIVNIASIMGLVGIGLLPQAAYNASKGAVVNLTLALAAQWARRGCGSMPSPRAGSPVK